MFPIIDGHLDLAYNALHHDRDQTLPLEELRARELACEHSPGAMPMVTLPQMQTGGVAVCVATLYTRSRCPDDPRQAVSRSEGDYTSALQAHADARGQLTYYQALDAAGHVRLIHTREALADLWRRRNTVSLPSEGPPPLGMIVMIEGADPILSPAQVHQWWSWGVRVVSLVHGGVNAYAVGTGEEGPLTPAGKELLAEMDRCGVILDLSHLSDASLFEALDTFAGPVIATHTNCRKFVPGNRHFTDQQIRLVVERGGVIGVVTFNKFISPVWQSGVTPREAVPLDALADHIDHICQLAGSALHAAIGSDLDGGFGQESCPHGLDSIADLPRLAASLNARGYRDEDIAAICHGNWLRFFQNNLPGGGTPG